MNAIVKQRIKDIESKADIVFADKTVFGKTNSCEEIVNTNIIPVDYVKVVRCKDCKHSEYREDYDDYECRASGCGLVYNADFFCADGEERNQTLC